MKKFRLRMMFLLPTTQSISDKAAKGKSNTTVSGNAAMKPSKLSKIATSLSANETKMLTASVLP